MAPEVRTMGEIAEELPADGDESAWSAIVGSIDEHFPTDWRSWEIRDFPYVHLFGEEIQPTVESKIRFAIPTEDLARAFNATTLSERTYRQIRRKLLSWPLGRALLYSPHNIMEQIHERCYKKFMDAVSTIKSKVTPRKSTSSQIRQSHERQQTPTNSSESSRKRRSGDHEESVRKRPAYDATPDRRSPVKQGSSDHLLATVLSHQMELFSKLIQVSADTNENVKHLNERFTCLEESKPTAEDSSDSQPENASDVEIISDQETVSKPNLSRNVDPHNSLRLDSESSEKLRCRETELRSMIAQAQLELAQLQSKEDADENETYDFDPATIEKESKFSKADPALQNQAIECQRLGTESWEYVRYGDVQRQFQATPTFCALKTNNLLASVTPNWSSTTILEKFDLSLGAITNGLLQQRRIFKELWDSLPGNIRIKVGKQFLAIDSKFRKNSDSLLQYVCGRRAEVIKTRRNLYKPKNKILHSLLHSIPPSGTHLFDDDKFNEIVKQQGNINKFFPFNKRGGEQNKRRTERKAPATATANFTRRSRPSEGNWNSTNKRTGGQGTSGQGSGGNKNQGKNFNNKRWKEGKSK